MQAQALDRQRIDKWLWHARVVRTRSAAAALAGSGHVRVNGQRIDLPSRVVRVGDVVTVALDRAVKVLKVTAFAERRGSAESARALMEDLAPAPQSAQAPPPPVAGVRSSGAGRPTKRDRRAIAQFKGEDDF
jgi:ribosome-associated heat shock protein Hsp15